MGQDGLRQGVPWVEQISNAQITHQYPQSPTLWLCSSKRPGSLTDNVTIVPLLQPPWMSALFLAPWEPNTTDCYQWKSSPRCPASNLPWPPECDLSTLEVAFLYPLSSSKPWAKSGPTNTSQRYSLSKDLEMQKLQVKETPFKYR